MLDYFVTIASEYLFLDSEMNVSDISEYFIESNLPDWYESEWFNLSESEKYSFILTLREILNESD